MKGILLIFVISFFFVTVHAQDKVTDREFDEFKSKVKSVISTYSSFRFEVQSGVRYEQYYDENGNIIRTVNYINEDVILYSDYSIINGEKTYKQTTNVQGKSNALDIKSAKYRDDRYSVKLKYKYDEKNRIKEESLYRNDGEFISRSVYKYDLKGRKLEVEYYSAPKSDKASMRVLYKYDKNDIPTQSISYQRGNDNDVTERIYSDYKFDAQGNWIERTSTIKRSKDKGVITKQINYRKIEYFDN